MLPIKRYEFVDFKDVSVVCAGVFAEFFFALLGTLAFEGCGLLAGDLFLEQVGSSGVIL